MPELDENLQRSDIRDRLDRLDARMKFEFELVNHRLSWLLSFNAFMLGGFAISLNHSENDSTILNADALSLALTWVLPVLGLISCFLVWYGVQAAHSVILSIKTLRIPLEDQAHKLYGLDRSSVDSKDLAHIAGNAAPFWIPIILFFAWAYLLYIRLS